MKKLHVQSDKFPNIYVTVDDEDYDRLKDTCLNVVEQTNGLRIYGQIKINNQWTRIPLPVLVLELDTNRRGARITFNDGNPHNYTRENLTVRGLGNIRKPRTIPCKQTDKSTRPPKSLPPTTVEPPSPPRTKVPKSPDPISQYPGVSYCKLPESDEYWCTRVMTKDKITLCRLFPYTAEGELAAARTFESFTDTISEEICEEKIIMYV